MNRKYNSTSVLLRSPKLQLNETPKRLSDLSSKWGTNLKDNSKLQTTRILCNVEDVFKKSPVHKTKQINTFDHTRTSSSCLLTSRLHRSNEKSYQDSNASIDSKISSIVHEIHELTLGPNAISSNDFKDKQLRIDKQKTEKKSTLPCQDPKVSSEDSNLDEDIRIYLKNECMDKPRSVVPRNVSEAINKFNCKQKQDYLASKKSIEHAVISDQLREQSQFSTQGQVSSGSLAILEKNKAARLGILNVLKEINNKMVKKKEMEQEERKKEKEKQEQLIAICKLVSESFTEFTSKEKAYLANLKCCSDVGRFQKEGQDFINFNKTVCVELSNLVTKCHQSSVSRDDVHHLTKLMSRSKECFERLNRIHETIEEDAKRREAAKLVTRDTAEPATRGETEQVLAVKQEVSPEVMDTPDSKSGSLTDESGSLNSIIDASSLVLYKTTSGNYRAVEKQLDSLMQDASVKSYRFQCMKAFNIPINAISGLDGKHTLEMYNRLVSVLNGDRVLTSGSRVSQHPLGVLFCKYSMAKKFVAQVDVKPRVLFAYASVIVELWREFPDFGDLLLGEFHKQCPYLIPVFWPQLQGQSNEEYYKSLGYQYTDDQVEKQDLFLKRMTAMVQLYAAITISSTRSSGKQPHPHNLRFSWRWMAAMLNLEPQPDISATLLYSYIKIAGNKMAAVYKTQFFKLIHFIQKHYLQRIKQVTPEDQSQQSIAILEELISKIVKTKHVAPPEGQLPLRFW